MIPVATKMTEIDNLPGEEVQFTISDPRWVMRSLSDLYSDRELAVIREYSTNARDAMIESGNGDKPVLVTLPSAVNPYFTVQDQGIGMSEEDLKGTYTRFGDSTKRESNDFNGMLGFGSKSAVAYTNTFTVTGVKDGVKTIAVITRKEDYSIVLKIVASVATNEHNGVTVQIPVQDHRSFVHRANDFYRFWKPGTVLVNGEQPEWIVGEELSDGLFLNSDGVTSYVVMGNVAYRIANPAALFPTGMKHIHFVAYVENGAVEFTPNREDLKYSEHTKATLHKVIGDFVATALEQAKKEIASSKTHHEAFAYWTKWRDIVGHNNVSDLTFNGDQFVDTFKTSGYLYNSSSDRYNTRSISAHSVRLMSNSVIITGFPSAVSSHHKKRAREWRTLKSLRANYFVFTTEEKVENPWIDPSRVVSWEQVKKDVPPVKRPRPASTSVAWGRKAGTFDLITKDGIKTEQDIPDTKELYWISVQDSKVHGIYNISAVLKTKNLSAVVVIVPANRLNKFQRNYSAKPIMGYLKSLINLDGPSLISDEGRTYFGMTTEAHRTLSEMNPEKIDDPELRKSIEICKKSRNDFLETYNTEWNLACLVGERHNFKRVDNIHYNGNKNPLEKYPLVDSYSLTRGVTSEHSYLYINHIFKLRKEGNNV